jgi:hypothetical protein
VVKVQRNGFALGNAVPQVETIPPLLFVVSPNGQQMCAGVFMLVSGMSPNGMPLWRKAATDSGQCRWLYSSINGNWNIGGHKAEANQFHCHAAHIFSDTRHNGAMPHHATGSWWRQSGSGFLKDPAITVSTIKTANNLDQYLNDWPIGEKSSSRSCGSRSTSRPSTCRGVTTSGTVDFGRGSCDEQSSTRSQPSQVGGSARSNGGEEGQTPPKARDRLRHLSPDTPGASSASSARFTPGAQSLRRTFPPALKEFKTPPECIHDPSLDRDVQLRLRLVAQKLQDLEKCGQFERLQGDGEDSQPQEMWHCPLRLQDNKNKRLPSSSSGAHKPVEVSFFPSVKRRDTKVTFVFNFRPLGIEFENVREMIVVKGFAAGSGAPAKGVREGMVIASVGGVDISQWTFQEGLEHLWREVA